MRTRFLWRVPALVAALGTLPLLAIVLKRGVDIPFWDEWEWTDLIYAAHTHALTFDQLWLPHNEHRVLIPNLLVLALDAVGGWHVVREQVVSLIMLGLTQLVVWLLIRRTVRWERAGVCLFVVTAVLLGLAQFENLDWGFQMAWFLCDLGLVVAVWALTRPNRGARDIVFAVLAATVASLSSSQGLVVWASGLVAIVVVPRRVVPTAIAWLALGSVVTALVRSGSPGAGGPGHVGSSQMALLANYVLIYLGAPLAASHGRLESAFAGGALVVWLLLLAAVALRKPLTQRVRLAPWLAIGLYPVLCASLTAAGRAGFGLDQALSSRYTSIAALAWTAAVAGTLAVLPRGGAGLAFVAVPLAAVLFTSGQQTRDGNELWHLHAVEMRTARAEIAAGDPSGLKLVYPDRARVTKLLRDLAAVNDGPFSAASR